MQPAKVNVLIGQFCYSGNGGFSSILPQIGDWWAKVYHEMMGDERINVVAKVNLSDTPVTCTRNKLLRQAVAGGFDVLLLLDSDNEPDLYVGHDSAAKPFWKSSFDFAYRRLTQGLPTCIGAPYCGPPPHPTGGGSENVYVFKWLDWESVSQGYGGAEVAAYDRNEAALMTGIAPAAALPTGLMLLTVNALECIKPPYFRYEWKDAWEAEKASTEDVYFTRNLAMAGRMKWGAPIVFANWDAWAGHHKPKCVGKPVVLRLEQVCETFAEAVRNNFGAQEQMVFVNPEMGDAERAKIQAELEAVAVDQDGNFVPIKELDQAPVAPLADIDREHLKEFLDVWNKGGNPKRILYCGEPDFDVLDMLVRAARGGSVFCATDALPNAYIKQVDILNQYERRGVRFVFVDDIATADFWNTDKADLVFIHESALSQDLLNNALVFVSEDGMILGTGVRPLEVEGTLVHRWSEGGLWAVFAGQPESEAA